MHLELIKDIGKAITLVYENRHLRFKLKKTYIKRNVVIVFFNIHENIHV